MHPTDSSLAALADLLGAGLAPLNAAETLARAGGAGGLWARALAADLRGGATLNAALSRTLPPALIEDAGGLTHCGEAAALRYLVAARAHRRQRMRAMRGALLLPAAFALMTVASARIVLSTLNLHTGALWMDLAPLLLLLAAPALALRPPSARPKRPLGLVTHLRRPFARAELTLALAGMDPRQPAAAFRFAAARCPPPFGVAADSTARLLEAGAALEEAAPSAAAVGEPLAQALVTGAAVGDLPQRLGALAAEQQAHLTRRLRQLATVAAWLVLMHLSVQLALRLTTFELPNLSAPGTLETSPELRELLRELDLP